MLLLSSRILWGAGVRRARMLINAQGWVGIGSGVHVFYIFLFFPTFLYFLPCPKKPVPKGPLRGKEELSHMGKHRENIEK